MPRADIPKTVRGRLLIAMKARGLTPAAICRLAGWSSSRLGNYTSGRNRPPPEDAGSKLGKILGFNLLWLYDGDIENGVTTEEAKEGINRLLDEGWTELPPQVGRGRPRKTKSKPQRKKKKSKRKK